jgi:acyl carrier protein
VSSTSDSIRQVLESHGQLPVGISTLRNGDDLYQNGLTSHASVNVMLALEDTFNIEFPDSMLRKSTFQSVAAIAEVLISLGVEEPQH